MNLPKNRFNHTTIAEDDFIIIRDNDIGNILIGCPPEAIKYFNREKEPIPANVVVPQRTFRKGKNFFDIEFLAYTVIFFQKTKTPINIICAESQEERIRIILREALIGPNLTDIFETLLARNLRKQKLKDELKISIQRSAPQLGKSKKLYSLAKKIIGKKNGQKGLESIIQHHIIEHLKETTCGNTSDIEKISQPMTNAYVKAAMLKIEINVFAVCDEFGFDNFINTYVKFHHFRPNGSVNVAGNNGVHFETCQNKRGAISINKYNSTTSDFSVRFSEEKKEAGRMANTNFEIPEFGLTFVGSGTGFDPETYTSCFIIWINGYGIAVDLVANCEQHFRQLGFSSDNIKHIFLSHSHGDHDAGVLEKIMVGEKINLLTSDIIFDSFLLKAEALTKFSKEEIKKFVCYTALEEEKEIAIPGIDRTFITFDYAFHSIPSGRFKLRYRSLDGEEKTIGFSGDTKYSKEFVNRLHNDGIITAARRDKILGFLWDSDLIIHEAGGGKLHTNITDLEKLPQSLLKKCILIHTDKETRKNRKFHFAEEGETIHIIKKKHPQSQLSNDDIFVLINNTGLFPKLTQKRFGKIMKNAGFETFTKGQCIFKLGHKDNLYIILSGFAEVLRDKEIVTIYGKGCFFCIPDELNSARKYETTVKARNNLEVLYIKKSAFRNFNNVSFIQECMFNFVNFFSDWPPSSLIGYLSQSRFLILKKGDDIVTHGDTSNDVYVLINGKVNIVVPDNRHIAQIESVDILGEIAFFKQVPRTTTVTVSTDSATVLCVNEELFSVIAAKFPSFHGTILKKMDRRLQDLKDKELLTKIA